jgi:hypothetical protein
MNVIVTSAAVVVAVFAFGGTRSFAMGGGGNLSPIESPYAILAPITVAPLVTIDGRATYANGEGSPSPGRVALPPRRFHRGRAVEPWLLGRPSRSSD